MASFPLIRILAVCEVGAAGAVVAPLLVSAAGPAPNRNALKTSHRDGGRATARLRAASENDRKVFYRYRYRI